MLHAVVQLNNRIFVRNIIATFQHHCRTLSSHALNNGILRIFLFHVDVQKTGYNPTSNVTDRFFFVCRNYTFWFSNIRSQHSTSITSVHPSVCNVGGLWSRSATKAEICSQQSWWMSWLPARQSRPGLWYPVIPNYTEKDQWSGSWKKCGVLHFSGNNLSISASSGSHAALSHHPLSFLSNSVHGTQVRSRRAL